MAIALKSNQTVRITINKPITRESARKTLERLFMADRAVSGPMHARSRNFVEIPKRRGGCIWTKRCNKLHPELVKGATATFKMTPQTIRDLNSVSTFIEIAAA